MVEKKLVWNLGKNSKLKEERGVSFEEVEERVLRGAYRLRYLRSKAHFGQPYFWVSIRGRRWIVPFKEYRAHIYLFTIFSEG